MRKAQRDPTGKRPSAILVRPRVYIGEAVRLGPGKIDLLRAIDATHSISAAARSLGMSYKRAWLLVEALHEGIGRPVIETATGGRGGGGAALTALGRELVAAYDALEARLNRESVAELEALRRLVR